MTKDEMRAKFEAWCRRAFSGEVDLRRYCGRYACPATQQSWVAWKAATAESERRMAILESALTSISNNTCCDRCQEAALVARAALESADHSKNVRASSLGK